ncbi:MAG: anti-sigma factor [Acidimicrobiales bacterium]|nr:anti-sigma factor [Acidimicrobiales bacterium]
MNADLHHLAAAYALDALDDDERAAFEAHYPTCDICSSDVVDYRETAAVLASADAAPAPAGLGDRVMAEIAQTRQIPPIVPDRVVDLADRRRNRTRRAGFLAAAAAAVIAIVGFAVSLRGTSGTDDFERVLGEPDAVVLSLEGDDGEIRVVWSAALDQVVVIGNGLADPGPGFIYELWFLLDEGVAPAGLFRPDDNGVLRAVLDVDDIDGGGFGVTIEPAGGSDQPTGAVLYAGTV